MTATAPLITLDDPWFDELLNTDGLQPGRTYLVNGCTVYTPDGHTLQWAA